jgi:hypothetical protein
VPAATRADEAFLHAHVKNMVRALEQLQFGEAFARTVFEQPWSLLAVVRFTARRCARSPRGACARGCARQTG